MKIQFNTFILGAFLLVGVAGVKAQEQKSKGQEQSEYAKVADSRAEKIVTSLALSDTRSQTKVKEVIAGQYVALHNIEEEFNVAKAAVKANAGLDKKTADEKIAVLQASADKKVEKLHPVYLKKLGKHLNADQVEKVKDGMTYNVMPITYKGYTEMLPDLTEAQKAQIKAWLVEAREHAIDAGSSDKKHWWFGKYKGRINNYLSKEGIDTQSARAIWEKKLKEREEAAKNSQK